MQSSSMTNFTWNKSVCIWDTKKPPLNTNAFEVQKHLDCMSLRTSITNWISLKNLKIATFSEPRSYARQLRTNFLLYCHVLIFQRYGLMLRKYCAMHIPRRLHSSSALDGEGIQHFSTNIVSALPRQQLWETDDMAAQLHSIGARQITPARPAVSNCAFRLSIRAQFPGCPIWFARLLQCVPLKLRISWSAQFTSVLA